MTFEESQEIAEQYARQKEKLSRLLRRAARKAERNYEFLLPAWESLRILLRLVGDWLTGKYQAGAKVTVMAISAVVYFYSWIDLIPDSIPVLGFVDDTAVITSVVRANLREISAFRNWESKLGP